METINIICFGFGQVAKNFIKKINSENLKINLTVTSREKSNKKKFDGLNYESFQFSEHSFDKRLIENLKYSNHILVSIAPVNGEDIVIKNFKNIFDNSNPKWIKGIKGPIGKIRLLQQLQFYEHEVQFTAFGTILHYLY